MDVALQAGPVVDRSVGRRDQVGLVERLAVPDRRRDKVEVRFELHIGIAADPRRLDLAGNQQRSDFLIGAARDEFDGTADLGSKIGLADDRAVRGHWRGRPASGRI